MRLIMSLFKSVVKRAIRRSGEGQRVYVVTFKRQRGHCVVEFLFWKREGGKPISRSSRVLKGLRRMW
jgi:hypothetical protein